MKLIKGDLYTRKQIQKSLGGDAQQYLPHSRGRVVAGCFSDKANPDAPDVILAGSTPTIYRWATVFCKQKHAVPVFMKIANNEWRYIGNRCVVRWTESKAEIVKQAKRSARNDIKRVIFLGKGQVAPTTYLCAWNPSKWKGTFSDIQDHVQQVKNKGSSLKSWNTGRSRQIRKGDRIFLIRLGKEPRGIFASGWAESEVYDDIHWNEDLARTGKSALYIDMQLDTLLNPDAGDRILSRDSLETGVLRRMHWDTQSSGVVIPSDVADALETRWKGFTQNTRTNEIGVDLHAIEGLKTEATHHIRARNRKLRNEALRIACGVCCVCDTDFSRLLCGSGKVVLQVHHRKQLASSDSPTITRLKDLAVVCANCHLLIHINPRKALKVEVLKKRLAV